MAIPNIGLITENPTLVELKETVGVPTHNADAWLEEFSDRGSFVD